MATFDTGNTTESGNKLYGYAGDSTTLIQTGKKGSSGRVLYKAGKGGSVSRTPAEQTPPSNELPAGQQSQYEAGRPGEQINPPKQTIKVEVNQAQVEQLNREVDARELSTALIEGRVIKKGEGIMVEPRKNQAQPYIPMTEEEKAKLTAPRQVSPQETTPVNPEVKFDNPFPTNPTYGGQINAGNKPQPTDTRSTPVKINQAFEEAQAKFMIASSEPGTLLPLIAVPARFAYGFINEPIEIGKGIAEVGKQAIAGANLIKLGGQVLLGTAEAVQGQVERTSVDVWTGNIPGLAEESGRFYAQYKLAKATDVIIGKPIKAGLKAVDTFIGPEWEGTPKIPEVIRSTPENPAFSRPWQDTGIRDITPRTPSKDFTKIPTEYTELAKNLEIEKTKVQKGSLDATQGETLPGTWLKESQPVDKQAELYYLEYGNKPPELQTILSKEQQKTNLPIRTTEEILAWQKETKATQLKLGEKVSKRPGFFDSERGTAWRERLKEAENIKSIQQAKDRAESEIKLVNDLDFLKRRAEYKKAQAEESKMTGFEEPKTKAEGEGTSNPIYSSQPVMAIAQTIVQEAPKINDWLKNKYSLYKQSLIEERTPIIAPPKELSIQNAPDNFNLIMTINPGNTPTVIQQPSIITGNKASVSSKPAVEIKSYPPIQIQTQETTQIQSNSFLHQGSQRQSQEQIQNLAQVQTQSQGQTQIQSQAQAQLQAQQQTQIQKQANIFKNQQRTPTEIITQPFPKARSPEQKRGSPFTVQVRKKGIFQTAGQTETLGRAVTLGETLVENSASASFRISQEGKTVTNINPGREFTKSKKEAGVMIQQNKFRIGTPGEKTEITQKGILANKGRKKRRKGQWGF